MQYARTPCQLLSQTVGTHSTYVSPTRVCGRPIIVDPPTPQGSNRAPPMLFLGGGHRSLWDRVRGSPPPLPGRSPCGFWADRQGPHGALHWPMFVFGWTCPSSPPSPPPGWGGGVACEHACAHELAAAACGLCGPCGQPHRHGPPRHRSKAAGMCIHIRGLTPDRLQTRATARGWASVWCRST